MEELDEILEELKSPEVFGSQLYFSTLEKEKDIISQEERITQYESQLSESLQSESQKSESQISEILRGEKESSSL